MNARTVLLITVLAALLVGGCSYRDSALWRRSVCDDIVDAGERERCLETATRSEGDYERDVEEALEAPAPRP